MTTFASNATTLRPTVGGKSLRSELVLLLSLGVGISLVCGCADDRIPKLEGQVQMLNERLDALTGAVAGLHNALVAQSLVLTGLEQWVTNRVEQLTENTSSSATQLALLDSRLDLLAGSVTNQFVRLAENASSLSTQVTGFDSRLAWLTECATSLWDQVGSLNAQMYMTRTNLFGSQRTVYLDYANKGYQRIDTDAGSFFIFVQDVQPFLNGYKLRLQIGNPSAADFNGFRLNLVWGRHMAVQSSSTNAVLSADQVKEATQSLVEWAQSLHSKDVDFVDELKPGCWTRLTSCCRPRNPMNSDTWRWR